MIDTSTNGAWHAFCPVRLLAKCSSIISPLVVLLCSGKKNQVLIKRLLSNRLSCHSSVQKRKEKPDVMCCSATVESVWSFHSDFAVLEFFETIENHRTVCPLIISVYTATGFTLSSFITLHTCWNTRVCSPFSFLYVLVRFTVCWDF